MVDVTTKLADWLSSDSLLGRFEELVGQLVGHMAEVISH